MIVDDSRDDVDLASAEHMIDIERDCARDVSRCHLRQPWSGSIRLAQQGDESGDRGQQRARRDDPTKLLGDDGELGEAQADAAVLLRDRKCGPVEADERVPQLAARVGVSAGHHGVDVSTHEGDGALLREHRPNRVAQLLLLRGEVELHQPSPSCTSDASARRSSFSMAVSGSASVMTMASGSLYAARWSVAKERS